MCVPKVLWALFECYCQLPAKFTTRALCGALTLNPAINCLPVQLHAHLNGKKTMRAGWSEAWLHRPLDAQLLEYAVYDVASILALYQHFWAAGARCTPWGLSEPYVCAQQCHST
jgi:hypothetical protein